MTFTSSPTTRRTSLALGSTKRKNLSPNRTSLVRICSLLTCRRFMQAVLNAIKPSNSKAAAGKTPPPLPTNTPSASAVATINAANGSHAKKTAGAKQQHGTKTNNGTVPATKTQSATTSSSGDEPPALVRPSSLL